MVFLTIVTIVVSSLLYFWFKQKSSRLSSKIPGPKGLPLLGNVLDLNPKHVVKTLEEWAMEHGPVYKFSAFGRETLVVSDLQEINTLLKRRPEDFKRPEQLADAINSFRLIGLFTLEGSEWKESRNIIAPSLAPARVNEMKACVWSHTLKLRKTFANIASLQEKQCAEWFPVQSLALAEKLVLKGGESGKAFSTYDKKKLYDVLTPLQEAILGIVLETSFSWGESTLISMDLLERIKDMFAVISDRFLGSLPVWKVWQSPRDIKAQKTSDELLKVIEKVIETQKKREKQEKKKEAGEEEEVGAHLKRTVLANILENKGKLTDATVVGNIAQVILAGYGNEL
jgi:cytochrome P450